MSSEGFDSEEYPREEVPFNTPLGLAFAVATVFNCAGVHIEIKSESPPKSALGGSGVSGVALILAFSKALQEYGNALLSQREIVELAYQI